MSNKMVPPQNDETTSVGDPQRTKVARRRFAEGETSIVRLDELLRQRTPQQGGLHGAGAAEPTKVARPQPAPVSAEDQRLLELTQPKESQTAIRRRDEVLRAPRTAAPSTGASAASPAARAIAASADVTRSAERSALGRSDLPTRPDKRPEKDIQTQIFSGDIASLGRPAAQAARAASALEVARAQAERDSNRDNRALRPPPLPQSPSSASAQATAKDLQAPHARGPLSESKAPPLPPVDEPIASAAPKVQPKVAQRRVQNHTIAFFGCKGGAGSTTLSLNCSHTVCLAEHTACLVDMDLQLGDALAAFGLAPKFSLAQSVGVVAEGGPFGKALLPAHASGVQVVSQVGNLNDLDRITPESIGTLLEALRQEFDTVVIDGLRDFGDNTLAVLDQADVVAVVVVQEVLAIRRARWTYSILQKIGFAPADLCIVVNRFSPQSEISIQSLRSMFAPSPVIAVTHGSDTVTRAMDRGLPLAEASPTSPVAQSVVAASSYLVFGGEAPSDTPSAAAADSSLLNRIFRRKEKTSP